ncbi:unnamed protein product [Rotaria sordida]|uniref:Piezo TM1-24 domain-containing protein n=1 Tax=Rotaria sordida TaxID=392033 RepID=A0A819TC03_9BILA|nr:unnamed protein product [Rotaria sordida]CAF4070394.1 unnamed protein product [Rotaria sordida]
MFTPLVTNRREFEKVNIFLSQKFSKELLALIGLKVVPSDVLTVKLLTSSTFLMVNILQLHYIHSGWMKLIRNTKHSNSSRTQQILNSESKIWQESLYKLYFQANRFYKQITYYTWCFAEIHAYKLVLFLMVLTSVLKMNLNSTSIQKDIAEWFDLEVTSTLDRFLAVRI